MFFVTLNLLLSYTFRYVIWIGIISEHFWEQMSKSKFYKRKEIIVFH